VIPPPLRWEQGAPTIVSVLSVRLALANYASVRTMWEAKKAIANISEKYQMLRFSDPRGQ